jgi:hypothetical protein
VTIVGAAENDGDAPGVLLAEGRGLKVHESAEKIVEMGDDIDVIFDLTGNPEARKSLREAMVRTGNTHTVIAPEIMSYLIWGLIAEGEELPEAHTSAGY